MQSNLISTHTTISCNFTSHFKYSWERSEKKTAKHHEKLMRWKINSSRADLVENSVAKKNTEHKKLVEQRMTIIKVIMQMKALPFLYV